jgi:parallel beta-helix repeat protein
MASMLLSTSASIRFAPLILLSAAMTAPSATYFVATDGKPENDGTSGQPWPAVEHALAKVGGGHTILVKPGIYRGPIQISRQFAGTRERPTVIQSEVKWKAVVIGAEYHVISNGDGCDWVTVDGFEVLGARYDGIKLNGDHNVVRNCWVHNNQAMGVAMHNKRGGLIENNLIEFNGSHVQFDHGVYADGEELTVRGNVIRHNANFGLHLYPSIKNSRIENNLVYGQVRGAGIIVSCPEGGGRNVIVNNTVLGRHPLILWHGNGETVVNNILVADGGEALSFNEGTTNVIADYNLCSPKSAHDGPHGVTGDPLFADANKGLFWLRAESPVRGRGSSEHSPVTDFWGRTRSQGQPPDLGAMPFASKLLLPEVRDRFEYGWAYYRHGARGTVPDFWALALETSTP